MAVPDRAPAQAVAPPAPAVRGIAALEPVPPVLLVIAGATSIQFGAALAATLFDDLGTAGTSLVRLGFAAVILVALWRPRPSAYSASELRLAALFGLMLGVMNLSFYEALDRIPLGIAVTLEFAGPVTIAVALSRRRLDLVWVALAVIGIVLLASPGGSSLDPVGLLFVAVAAMAWAAYILLAQRAGTVFSGGSGLAIAMVVGALLPLGPGIVQAGSHLLDPGLLALGVGVALLSSVIPYTFETEALRRVPAHVFSVLMSLEPAVAAIAGYLILHQRLSTRDVVAIGLVIAASIGATRSRPPAIEA
jgi:inner membrane transporter RhtA